MEVVGPRKVVVATAATAAAAATSTAVVVGVDVGKSRDVKTSDDSVAVAGLRRPACSAPRLEQQRAVRADWAATTGHERVSALLDGDARRSHAP